MAAVARSDPKLRKPFPKPQMLKDFLLDDMSSCSSNGFKSFPRRHCCTTVRYLVEKDLKAKDATKAKPLSRKSRSKAAASTTISALQRASEAVFNAVKLLPFSTVKSPSSSVKKRSRKGILARSLSRKLLKRTFWKRTAAKEEIQIERWKSFRDFLEEKQKSSAHSPHNSTTIDSTSVTTNSNSNSNSWSDGEFSSDYLQFSSCNSENSGENGAVSGKKYLPEKKVSKRVGVEVGEDSMEATATTCSVKNAKEWPNEEKEQLSPVSVLDCPFEDEDEEMCSPFQPRITEMEGSKLKLLQKIRRFEDVSELEPVDLEKRIALSELDDESPMQPSMPTFLDTTKEEMDIERQAQNLLKLFQTGTPSNSSYFKADNLLLDFFKERIMKRHENPNADEMKEQLLKVAQDWMSGHHRDLLEGWDVHSNRKAYIKDMEERGTWRKYEEEKKEMAAEMESEVLSNLLNEMLLEISTT